MRIGQCRQKNSFVHRTSFKVSQVRNHLKDSIAKQRRRNGEFICSLEDEFDCCNPAELRDDSLSVCLMFPFDHRQKILRSNCSPVLRDQLESHFLQQHQVRSCQSDD